MTTLHFDSMVNRYRDERGRFAAMNERPVHAILSGVMDETILDYENVVRFDQVRYARPSRWQRFLSWMTS